MAKNTQIPEQISTTESTENQETEQTVEQTPSVEPMENQEAEQSEEQTPPDEPTESLQTETVLRDIDIIAELTEAVKLQRTKRPEFVAKLIKDILSKDFAQSEGETKYTNAIYEIKEYIGNIKKNCPYRPSKCIVKVECTLKRLNDGDF